MSMAHAIVATVEGIRSRELVYTLLKQGESLDFVYYVDSDTVPVKISVDEALDRLFETDESLMDDGGPFVKVKFEDNHFFLWINSLSQGLSIEFVTQGSSWNKEFAESDRFIDIDYARYIRLMLKFVKGFNIISLKTETF